MGKCGQPCLAPMKIKSATFEGSVPDLESCPAPHLPEFAFIGRSNVGKSSLLNFLAGRKDLATVSSTPGRTRTLNFFLMNEAWFLVDLPGYGYSKAGKRSQRDFNLANGRYIMDRENLACVFVLIDSRHSPQKIDLEFVDWMSQTERPFALVFTKTDKLKPTRVRENVTEFLEAIGGAGGASPEVFTSSSLKKEGKEALLEFIGATLA